jgi:hypothetical protein
MMGFPWRSTAPGTLTSASLCGQKRRCLHVAGSRASTTYQLSLSENTAGRWRAWALTPDTYYPVYGALALSPVDGQVQISVVYEGGLWRITEAMTER